MRRLLVPSLFVLVVAAGCGHEKTYGARKVEQAFARHGLQLVEVRPVPTLMTSFRSGQYVAVLIYPNHRAAEAAVRSTKGRGVFSAFHIPEPARVGGITTFTNRNIVAIDVMRNTSTNPTHSLAHGTPGFWAAVTGLR